MTTTEKPEQIIQLQNPVQEHYETFIVANAVAWQVRCVVDIEPTLSPQTYQALMAEFEHYRPSAAYGESQFFHDTVESFALERYMVREGEAKGQHLILCGAGPSLRDHARDWCPQGDQVWGCNSAMTYLHDRGLRVTHGVTVDQTPQMCQEWASLPDVEYLIPSTAHPHLSELLRTAERRHRWFHNFVGIKKSPVAWADTNGVTRAMPYEEWLYALLFPPTVMTGSGLNSVTRALDLATFMGFDQVTVLGADCCLRVKGKPRHDLPFGSPKHLRWLRKKTVMHADGGHALASEASPLTLGGEIDGRYWLTKADMVISAQWLHRMQKASKGRITLIGDTLPNALKDKDEAYLRRLPNFVTADGRVANIPVYE